MKARSIKYAFLIFCLLISTDAFAQRLTATDTSERSVKRYRDLIRNNRELVNFIEYSLSSRGVPKHLRNLAIIESGLDHRIVSHAGATGLWQFMIPHANQYGLTDADRTDIYKSTKTVVSSLINLYKLYGNWVTVVAAFNCGEGNIQKAMNRAGSRRYTDFAPYLPAETQGHVRKFLNASYATGELSQVLSDYYKTGTPSNAVAQAAKPISKPASKKLQTLAPKNGATELKKGMSETVLNGAYDLDVIAEVLKIAKSDVLKWNPKIESTLAEKGISPFYLPDHKMMEFEMNRNRILSNSLQNTN